MIIGIDIRVLYNGSGGTFVYLKNLLDFLIPLAQNHQIKLFTNYYKKNSRDSVVKNYLKHKNVKLYKYKIPNKFLNLGFRFLNYPKIDKMINGCDVLLMPTMMYSAWSDKAKVTLVAHDLSFKIFPEFFTRKQNIWHSQIRVDNLYKKVNSVISVSGNTKKDLINLIGLKLESIQTVHSGVDSKFFAKKNENRTLEIKNKYNLPINKKIILQTGTIEPRKNHLATIESFNLWQKIYPKTAQDYILVLAGHKGWKNKKIKKIIKNSFGKVYKINDIDDSNLPDLYKSAEFFVYPSIYEGFGLPLLEAMASGIPIITTANSSLSEIASDCALYVDPYRLEDFVTAYQSLATDNILRGNLTKKGISRSKNFSWEKTAKNMLLHLENL